jgi:hypothetical protein
LPSLFKNPLHFCLGTTAILLAVMPGTGQALSIGSLPPHRPENACAATNTLLRRIITTKTSDEAPGKQSKNDLSVLEMSDDEAFFDGIEIVTDELGRVDDDEMPALAKSMSSHDGKPDKRVAKVDELRLIVNDKAEPLYVAVILRERWEKTRYTEMDGMGFTEALPPGYEERRSFWIVEFRSNRIETFREAGEMYKLAYRNDAPNLCR